MKHTRLPVLCLIVLLMLAACGQSDAAPTAVAEIAPRAAPTDPPPSEPPPTAPRPHTHAAAGGHARPGRGCL